MGVCMQTNIIVSHESNSIWAQDQVRRFLQLMTLQIYHISLNHFKFALALVPSNKIVLNVKASMEHMIQSEALGFGSIAVKPLGPLVRIDFNSSNLMLTSFL